MNNLSVQAISPPLSGGMRQRGVLLEGSADRPLVTVVTAAYNGQPYLSECLDSVLRQDYPNIEHIILDAGSRDGTIELLRQYDDRIALWRSEPDRGIYDAWNKALLEARGEWICFLGVDDEFLPGAVSAYMALATQNPDAEYLTSRVKIVHPSGYERVIGGPWTWREFSRWMCIAHVGSMHRRTLFERLGSYDPSYRIVADYAFLLGARDQLKTAYMPMITVNMRDGGVSRTLEALEEQAQAKICAGGRSRALATFELYIAKGKFMLRPLRYLMGRILAQRRKSYRDILGPV